MGLSFIVREDIQLGVARQRFSFDNFFVVTRRDCLARPHYQKILRVPLAIHPTLEQAEVAAHLLELPAAFCADLFHLLVELEWFGEGEINQHPMRVVLRPLVHHLHQIKGAFLAEFLHPLLIGRAGVAADTGARGEECGVGGRALLAAPPQALQPAGRVEVSTDARLAFWADPDNAHHLASFLEGPSKTVADFGRGSRAPDNARAGLERIPVHPIFGHGMDAMKLHWNEWGFPGKDMLHLHSTPLQLAFDRGLPMLAIWLWLMIAFWLSIARAERSLAGRSDTHTYGLLLGTLGALTGFLASSLVNYNYGDAEVAMLFWFLMGIATQTRPSLLT